MASPATFILVMAVSPRGWWRVHGLQFEREWRALQVGDKLELEPEGSAIPTIDERTKRQIEHDVKIGALAMKEATADEVEAYQAQIAATRGQDKDTIIADLHKKNADLEARLMKLELAVTGGSKGGGGAPPAPPKQAQGGGGAPPAPPKQAQGGGAKQDTAKS